MKKKTALLISLLLLMTLQVWSQSIWDATHLANVKQSINEPFYATAFEELKAEADGLLNVAPLSVMMKEKTPASGDKHDYMSQARYYWADPAKPDGLPYINRDGVSNPELRKLDRNRLGDTAERITTLSLAWYFTGEEQYAQKATELIRVWFFNKDTKMNPNLEYAQMIPGLFNNKGRSYGLIDAYSFVDMLDAVALLEQSKAFTDRDDKQLKDWFKKLTKWMITSEQGREEASGANNHSVAYDAQIIAFSLYIGDKRTAQDIINAVPEKRMYPQIDPDGSQPHELRRTLGFHYSQYNLTHFIDIMQMAKKLGISIDNATSADGRNFYKAMDFLVPYVGKSLSAWPYEQISGWDASIQKFCKDLYRTWLINPARKDYLKVYKVNHIMDYGDRFNLLYVKATEVDNAYAFASAQLKFAMQCASRAKNEEKNAARRRVEPRTINKNGQLVMIDPSDWCSGFFPGSLWQMFAYTNDDFWRESAISWTWPIEEAKWNKGTHDLGFMMYDSFGKAYELTGERSYKDVVLQSAKTLITRYNPKVKSIRSWDHNGDTWDYPVIIDNMMNLEMLFRATQLTGDSIYRKIAVTHANTTMKNHFRPDYSSFHVIDYNPETGVVQAKCTHQGYADDSFWSRGQAWGLYGFTMSYRFTRNPLYLKQSEGIADFILSLPNMPEDGVPFWDMKAPGTDIANNPNVPRDASAAAIMASALYELCTYIDVEKGKQYRAAADKIVKSLNAHYQAAPGASFGFLLLHSTGHLPGGSEIDVPLNYADYYYLEALARKEALELCTLPYLP